MKVNTEVEVRPAAVDGENTADHRGIGTAREAKGVRNSLSETQVLPFGSTGLLARRCALTNSANDATAENEIQGASANNKAAFIPS